jgi:hypothetical protein
MDGKSDTQLDRRNLDSPLVFSLPSTNAIFQAASRAKSMELGRKRRRAFSALNLTSVRSSFFHSSASYFQHLLATQQDYWSSRLTLLCADNCPALVEQLVADQRSCLLVNPPLYIIYKTKHQGSSEADSCLGDQKFILLYGNIKLISV